MEAEIREPDAVTPAERMAQGLWPYPVTQCFPDGHRERFFAAVGCSLGGSTIRYGAALERMAPSDFESLQTPHQSLPPWPVSYGEFLPFYEAAEALFGLGTIGDWAVDERLSEWDKALMAAMRQNGLRPERQRVAMRYDDACQECVGKLCLSSTVLKNVIVHDIVPGSSVIARGVRWVRAWRDVLRSTEK
jgi:choline dehydrogenase-like flavoprotein